MNKKKQHHTAPYLTLKHSLIRDARSPQRRFRIPSRVPPRAPGLRRPSVPSNSHRRRRGRIGTILVVSHPVELEVCPHAPYPAVLKDGRVVV